MDFRGHDLAVCPKSVRVAGHFSQDEAEAVVAGFGGDVRRASQLYRELTHDYAGFMTVEDIIKAGKD